MTIRVVLADDQALVRTGFRMILMDAPDIEVVGEAADGAEAVEVVRATQPDVVLMDVRMPGTDGVEATRRIKEDVGEGPGPRILILTTFDLDEYVFAAIRAGASGFLLKDTLAADLLSAIRSVASGDSVVAPSATRRLLERFVDTMPNGRRRDPQVLATLTAREREVLGLVAQGLSNAEIAANLFLSEGTVKTHVGRILAKLEARDRVQAVVVAYETGLVRGGLE
jgi:DNA-binding NarL/FixJ family response regulator